MSLGETSMNDMSLILEFVQEAREYIDEVEPNLIELYHGSGDLGSVDLELINMIFRLFHSMKGSAGFLSLTTVVGVTHEAETLLDKIRNGKLQLTGQMTETLCRALDLFRDMLDHIAETGCDNGFEDQAAVIIAKLKRLVAGEDISDESDVSAQTAKPELEPLPKEPATDAKPAQFSASNFDLDSIPSTCKISMEEILAIQAAAVAEEEEDRKLVVAKSEKGTSVQAEDPKTAPNAGQKKEATIEDATMALQMSPEMRIGFIQEGIEQMDALEQALLLVLDENVDSSEPLKEAFRYIHSFKGNCGFMGLKDLEHLSHTMETLLDSLRNGEIKPSEKNVGKLLSLIDVLRDSVNNLEAGGNGHIKDLSYHVRMLNSFMSGEAEESTVVTAPKTAGTVQAKLAASATTKVENGGSATSAGAATKAKQDIRVDLHKLDALINLVGELVIAESMVTRCQAVAHVEDEYYNRAKHQLRRICDDIKDVAMSVRMIPLSATFRKMIRLVHDLATKSNKKIKLNLIGEETEVDKTVIEQIADPLVHIVRNSCDHGVEGPEERTQNGKSDTGTVTLEGRHEGGEVWILIKDDGRGLNRDKIVAKALERGLVGQEIRDWPDEKVFRLIFEPGFSTADKVTDISGRGVGMDVVKRNIEKLNGRIDIQSKLGQGSTFVLRIPLTLAIIDAMLVRVGKGKYMIPTLSIRESLVPTMKQVTITPDGKEILRLREEMVPIVRLYDVFSQEPDSNRLKDGILIVAEDGGHSFAIFVDEIIGQQQTVIKGLPNYVGKANGFSGCTILGDGSVSLIIDIGSLSQMGTSFALASWNKGEMWGEKEAEAIATQTGDMQMSFEDLEAKVREITM